MKEKLAQQLISIKENAFSSAKNVFSAKTFFSAKKVFSAKICLALKIFLSANIVFKSKNAGSPVEIEEWPEMFHGWHNNYDFLLESRQAIKNIGKFFRKNIK